jgi:trans-aconitate methyltransferase
MRYQDYVIKDGKFVGDFEGMYRDCPDPWEQTTREAFASEKAVALNLIEKSGSLRVLEIGCGFGLFASKVHAQGTRCLGMDISPTAVAEASRRHPECDFVCADILHFDVYRRYEPDMLVLAEVTWYVLPKLEAFMKFFREEMKAKMIHLLAVYPPGIQKHGTEFFTDLEGMKRWFGLRYLEWGQVGHENGCMRTWFLGENK